jgi:predicted PurR-regulated permease PerM
MSKDKSSQMFNLKLLVMRKMKFYLMVLFACFILAIQLNGQNDSAKIDLNLSSDVVKKLDANDIIEIIKYKEKLVHEKEMAEKYADPGNIGKIVKGLMPSEFSMTIWTILTFAFVLLLITIPFYFNLKKTKGRQQIINDLIEKGREIPKELISASVKSGRSDFHKGVILIALGLSISIVLFVLKVANNYWTIGLIPTFIGIGYLISFKFDNSRKSKSEIE